MMALAGELNRRFCAERRIEALIMDDHRAASVWDPIHSPELINLPSALSIISTV